ncbi:hydrolase-HD superfamily protein [Rhizoctonia solani 123E]|uniref:Hydrolase-HD superfamily protein n=1 Tax=Rhizoctonia solani 123E TaxID=1423351 RepID=A0A074SRH5_9AGAM|nr:hydrolase-HD superfamily protein [Rhizoctonia solani 123E]
MHRMSILALCTSDANLDVSKCVMMAVVHDLAEAVVGDIAPWEGISKAEKVQREREGMKSMLSDMLHDGPGAIRIRELWEEYEEQATPEAKFVKDLDRLEMALQAAEYERKFPDEPNKLQSFFDSSLPDIKHPEVAQWGGQLQEQRTKEQSVARSSVANDNMNRSVRFEMLPGTTKFDSSQRGELSNNRCGMISVIVSSCLAPGFKT